ncbi:thiamine pyrophosphate-binding protein [Streptomyces sp. NPDC059697]|uniref:thiamine pyrophosphate-binding protein n=1 Tax=Streptomyces sp. NPDC059697 TaxID=3346912 RepID=UPI00367A9FE1
MIPIGPVVRELEGRQDGHVVGVGALSAINGVAGAYSEHVPLVCIAGSLPLMVHDRGLLMQHAFADEAQDTFMRAYAP